MPGPSRFARVPLSLRFVSFLPCRVLSRRVVATGDGNDANDDKNTPTSELVCDASERCGASVRNTVDAYAQKADDVFDVVGVAVVVSARSRRVVKRRA